MKIKDMPFYNKPSYKLMNNGVESLDIGELLAIILGSGVKGESVLELSNRLLKRYNLNGLGELSFNELKEECKGDYVKALRILSLIELSKKYNKSINNGYKKVINNAKDVYDLLVDELRDKKKEYFICLYLDSKNKIIKKEVISIGTLNSSLVHPREVFKTAIKESANSIILVHNHPSGDPDPSREDINMTKQISEVSKILNILVLDHVIIGENNYWSWLDSQQP